MKSFQGEKKPSSQYRMTDTTSEDMKRIVAEMSGKLKEK